MKHRLGIAAAALVAFILLPGGPARAKPGHCGCGNNASIPTNDTPNWSPDGRRIVFSRAAESGRDIAVMNADGSKQHVLLRTKGDDDQPDWSPDGHRIAFTSFRDENYDIYVMNADGTGVTGLTSDAGNDVEPDWSPDGKSIAFEQLPVGDKGQIWVMDADGGNQHRLFADDDYDVHPTWSPDGSKIAFEGGLDDSFVDIVSGDGTGRVRFTTGARRLHRWSPDGVRILFRAYLIDSEDVFVINATAPTSGFSSRSEVVRARPGLVARRRTIAFSSTLDDTRQIYVVRADGNGLRRFTGVRRAFTSTGDRCTIVGTSRSDILRGTPADDNVCGLGGNDTILGLAGDDILNGGAGADRIDGGKGVDTLLGAARRRPPAGPRRQA